MAFSLICFLIVSLAISHAWNFSDFTQPIRKIIGKIISISYLKKPFLCPVCSSFWIGILTSLILNPFNDVVSVSLVSNIFCGFASYLLSVIFYPLMNQEDPSKIDLKGKKFKTTIEDWDNFYSNICKTGSFKTLSIIQKENDLIVFFY